MLKNSYLCNLTKPLYNFPHPPLRKLGLMRKNYRINVKNKACMSFGGS